MIHFLVQAICFLNPISNIYHQDSLNDKLLIINYVSLIFITHAKFLTFFILFDTIVIVNVLYNNL